MMNFVGQYRGMKCYVCSFGVYKDIYNKGMDVGDAIFIIGNTMVQNNKIIGYYDGKVIKEVYDRVPYLKEEVEYTVDNMPAKKPEPEVAKVPETAVTTEPKMEIKEIHFTDYSKVVDEFFALLEK